MKKTFVCNESMIITIPIGSFRDPGEGHLMPYKFHCVFRDSYKVLVVKGKPKSLGAVQLIAGVFLCTLGLLFTDQKPMIYTLPSVLFVVSGMVTYAVGQTPNMCVAKLSLSLNIINFFWSVAALTISALFFHDLPHLMTQGVTGLVMSLLVVENVFSLFLMYWLSQAICKQHFNTLPTVLLKQAD